jgi:hypothetical protein
MIDFGISLIATKIKTGNKIRLSTYPNIGIKSGIRSIGLKAYATIKIQIILGANGVLGFLVENQSINTSFFSRQAQLLSLSIKVINQLSHPPA